MAYHEIAPSLPAEIQLKIDQRTTTTAYRDDRLESPTVADTLLPWAALITIVVWAMTGVLMGLVLVWSLPFWLQVATMAAYLALSVAGWLPWQIARG